MYADDVDVIETVNVDFVSELQKIETCLSDMGLSEVYLP